MSSLVLVQLSCNYCLVVWSCLDGSFTLALLRWGSLCAMKVLTCFVTWDREKRDRVFVHFFLFLLFYFSLNTLLKLLTKALFLLKKMHSHLWPWSLDMWRTNAVHKPSPSEGSNQCHRCDTEGSTMTVSVINKHCVKQVFSFFFK